MQTYLLTWNPNRFAWHALNAEAAAVARGERLESRWSCGNTTSIPEGARFFMHRQGVPPRGIVGSGWVTRGTYRDRHWDEERGRAGDLTNYVGIRLDSLLASDADPLRIEEMPHAELRDVNWHTPASGIRVLDHAAAVLEVLWAQHRGEPDMSDQEEPVASALEGEIRVRMIQHRSRERALRAAKIQAVQRTGGLRCEVPGCGFDFQARYGDVGVGYAQVHHRTPLAALSAPTRVSLDDLAIVCANCHVMIHRGGECRDLHGLIPASAHGVSGV